MYKIITDTGLTLDADDLIAITQKIDINNNTYFEIQLSDQQILYCNYYYHV